LSGHRGVKVGALTLAVGMALAACGSSTKTTPGAANTGATTGGTTAAATGASGTPILVGSEASLSNPVYSTPQTKAGIVAAVDAINAAGGVSGHPLKLEFCDTAYDANKELACARQLISDHVSALLSPNILADQTGKEYTVAAAAQVPVIGGEGLSPAELNSPGAFPLSSGLSGWVYGAVDNLLASGARKVSILVDTNPDSEYFASLAVAALKSAGLTPIADVAADPTSDPTLTTAAAKATERGTDGIILAPSPLNTIKALQALKQIGYTGKTSSITALFQPAIIKAAGSAANGLLLTSQLAFVTDTSNPGIVAFLADMKKYQPSAPIDETTLFSWAATELFAKVMTGKTSFTGPAVQAAFASLSTPVDISVAAPYAVVGRTSPLSQYSRIFNPTVQDGTLTNGTVQPNGKGFVNPFTSLSSL
jgi:ABC-type branched-subunit amino acid transport system substrate-binding protein